MAKIMIYKLSIYVSQNIDMKRPAYLDLLYFLITLPISADYALSGISDMT